MGACLAQHWQAWEARGAEPWVVKVLRDGDQIPFLSLPSLSVHPIALPSYSPHSIKGKALSQEVRALLEKGAIEPAPSDPGFYSRLFVVEKATGGFRPVIDLSPLNKSVMKTKFRMETNRTILAAVQKEDWMISFDLKDVYF